MTAEAWTYIFVSLTFVLYIWIGWKSRVSETKGFFVAGQGVPALANGAATAADWMSAASFISMAGLISFMGYDGSIYLMGWTGGYVLLALLLAPYLRKYGKYTVPDFVGDRYYSQLARQVAVVAAIFVSLTYVVGQMAGVGLVFARFLQIDVVYGVIIGMGIVAFFSVLGGMKGITWTQVAQYGILIVAFLIPAFAISRLLTDGEYTVPQFAFTSSDIMTRLNQLHTDLGFKEYTEAFRTKSKIDVLFIAVALMVGTAGLPHVIVRFYTVPSVRAARWSAGWALLFIAILYTTAPAVGAFARYNTITELHNKPVAELDQTEWVQKWREVKDKNGLGLIDYQDKNGDGVITMHPDPEVSEVINFNRDIIVLSTPEVAGLSPWVIALVAAGGLAAALSTAAALLLVIASAIAHDIYYKHINPEASEARRVMVGRVMTLVGVVVAGILAINPPGFVGQVVAFAFGLAAASFFPAIILGIFNSRVNKEGAVAGMICGLGFTMLYIIGNKYFGMPTWFFGVSAEGIGTVGMMINMAVTLTVTHLTPPPPYEIRTMIEGLRSAEPPLPPPHEPEEAMDH